MLVRTWRFVVASQAAGDVAMHDGALLSDGGMSAAVDAAAAACLAAVLRCRRAMLAFTTICGLHFDL